MPFNLLKKYPDLLELMGMDEATRTASLQGIFRRDIEDNPGFHFRGKPIRPFKDDMSGMQTLFTHLTCASEDAVNEDGSVYKIRNRFEINRSMRLHWIRHHIEELHRQGIEVFSVEERDLRKRKDVIKTYIYDTEQEYIIVLEPQRSLQDYYLLTAYYLDKPEGQKTIKKKLKKRLPELH